jgi:hypothetical protein
VQPGYSSTLNIFVKRNHCDIIDRHIYEKRQGFSF